jgi:hypothetical protein
MSVVDIFFLYADWLGARYAFTFFFMWFSVTVDRIFLIEFSRFIGRRFFTGQVLSLVSILALEHLFLGSAHLSVSPVLCSDY